MQVSSQLKNRVVGAVVLIGVVALSWPFIFNQSPQDPVDRTSQVPSAPDFEKYTINEAHQADVALSDAKLPEGTTLLKEKAAPVVVKTGSDQAAVRAQRDSASHKQASTAPSGKKQETAIPDSAALAKTKSPKAVKQAVKTNATAKAKLPPKSAVVAALTSPVVAKPRPASKKSLAGPTWAVQIASFKRQSNAEKLKDELVSKGFMAYVQSSGSAKGAITRVLVGPESDKRRAQQVQRKLEDTLKLSTLLVRSEP